MVRGMLKNKKGQSAIEFIVVVLVVFFFLFFYLSISMVLVVSQYVDYATFMAARTLKSGYASERAQRANAEEVFRAYTQNVVGGGLLRTRPTLSFPEAEPGDPRTAGVVATYDLDLFYLPPIFIRGVNIPSRITLTSESFLGRDPSSEDCLNFFEDFASRFNLGIQRGDGAFDGLEDTGC